MIFSAADPPDHVHIPKAREAVWVERLIWVFVLSFALDHRNEISNVSGGSIGLDQFLFLGTCIMATLGIVALGWRYVTFCPAAWLVVFWTLFLAYMLIDSTLQGVTDTRKADAIIKTLSEDSVHSINGKALGSPYYWDAVYLPESLFVFPKDSKGCNDIWFAGQSARTNGLLSGGVIVLLAYLVLFASTGSFSLLAARANASDAGPDQWLAFLPFVATCFLISKKLTANPFQGRLIGMMVGLPKAIMVRASWIHTGAGTQPAYQP